MPPLTEGRCSHSTTGRRLKRLALVLAAHATDPPPISTTIRKCASEFKKVRLDFSLRIVTSSDKIPDTSGRLG